MFIIEIDHFCQDADRRRVRSPTKAHLPLAEKIGTKKLKSSARAAGR
jgi:hypothetical protein